MTTIDRARLDWITRNLTITHDQLSREEARDWLRLMMSDWEAFMTHALYGLALRRQLERNATKISGQELVDYCCEFGLKIQLANRNRRITVSFPLFEVVGREVLGKFGLISGQAAELFGEAQ